LLFSALAQPAFTGWVLTASTLLFLPRFALAPFPTQPAIDHAPATRTDPASQHPAQRRLPGQRRQIQSAPQRESRGR